jgi:hypothetical protein
MSLIAIPANAYADLGDAWVRQQAARIQQKHLQFGRRRQLDLDALLSRAAAVARAGRSVEVPAVRELMSADRIRRTRVEAVAYRSQRSGCSSARVVEMLVD